jgi:hypothetical protein
MQQDRVTWNALQERAQAERLAPQLYDIVRLWHSVPPGVRESLRRVHAETAAHNTLLFRDLADVLYHLATAGVEVILIKGAALSKEVYGNDALRPMADLDLLIPASSVDSAHGVIVAIRIDDRDGVHRPRIQQAGHQGVTAAAREQIGDEVQHRLGTYRFSGVVLPINVQSGPIIGIASGLAADAHPHDGPSLPRSTHLLHRHQSPVLAT